MEANSIKGMIQEISDRSLPEIVIGIVTQTMPVKVTLKDDSNIQLSMVSMIVPPHKQWYLDTVGNTFYMLAESKQKVYYLLDIINDAHYPQRTCPYGQLCHHDTCRCNTCSNYG